MAVSFNIQDNATWQYPKIMNQNSDISFNDFSKIINAVEIDWNNAILSDVNTDNGESTNPINDTSQLLDLINTMQKEIYVLTAAVIALISNPKKDYYWYIGTENSSSISNIQVDNTTPGWHKIGTSLNDFILNTTQSSNQVVLDTQNVKYYYYVIIPNDLHIYDSSNTTSVENTYFESAICNMTGYKALHYKIDPGTRIIKGIIIR